MAREKGMGSLQREKSGRFTARFSVDGKRFARSTRTRDKSAAEHYLNRMLTPYGRGEQILPLADVWREYEKSPARREQTLTTLNAKRVVWMKFAEWIELNHLEITQLKQLTLEVIAEYFTAFRIGHAASTYNNHICTLREVFRCVAPKAGLTDDPWAGIHLLPDDSHTRREFTLDELRRIQSAAASMGGDWPLLIAIATYTGLRLGDAICLAWHEVDLKRGIIQLCPRKTRKFGKMVTIPLHPHLLSMLALRASESPAALSAAEDFVMPEIVRLYREEHWRIDNGLKTLFSAAGIRTSVRIAGRRQNTPDATFHSLRHTFVSFAANAGVPLSVIASIVGHSSTAMTRHYYHENEQVLRKAIEAIPTITANTSLPRPPSPAAPSPKPAKQRPESIATRLKKLAQLLKENLISASEYETLRQHILADI